MSQDLAATLEALAKPGLELYVGGRTEAGELWQPYRRAKDKVELYPEAPQVPGCEADWVSWDPAANEVCLGLFRPALPSRCDRFVKRECPLMTGAGSEPS